MLIVSFAIGAQVAAQDLSLASDTIAASADEGRAANDVTSIASTVPLPDPIVHLTVRPASSRPSRIQVDLALDGPPLPPRLAAAAVEEVARVWAPYGVDVEAKRPGDVGRHGAVRLAVKLADRPDRPDRRGLRQGPGLDSIPR